MKITYLLYLIRLVLSRILDLRGNLGNIINYRLVKKSHYSSLVFVKSFSQKSTTVDVWQGPK